MEDEGAGAEVTRHETVSIRRASTEEVEFRGVLVPRKIEFSSLGLDDAPDVYMSLEVREGRAECRSIGWHAKSGGPAITSSELQQLSSLEAFVAEVFLRYSNVIAEFRERGGFLGGPFEGAPILLLHHQDRATGKPYVAPLFYLRDPDEDDVVYVFAARGGDREDPAWFHNLMAAGRATIEIGAQTSGVSAVEVLGERRDGLYREQARRFPAFAEYERRVAGVRKIPVVALRREVAEPKTS